MYQFFFKSNPTKTYFCIGNFHFNLVGKQLIGSIEEDGYIRRDMESIANDLAFSQGVETSLEEVESIWWTRKKRLPSKKILLKNISNY